MKRLVFKSIPEATTRVAMLMRDEVDVAYLLDASLAESIKRNPKLKLAFSGGIGTTYLDFSFLRASPIHSPECSAPARAGGGADRSATRPAEPCRATPNRSSNWAPIRAGGSRPPPRLPGGRAGCSGR